MPMVRQRQVRQRTAAGRQAQLSSNPIHGCWGRPHVLGSGISQGEDIGHRRTEGAGKPRPTQGVAQAMVTMATHPVTTQRWDRETAS